MCHPGYENLNQRQRLLHLGLDVDHQRDKTKSDFASGEYCATVGTAFLLVDYKRSYQARRCFLSPTHFRQSIPISGHIDRTMAIYSAVPPPHEQPPVSASPVHHHVSGAPSAPVDVEAWTVAALQSLSISPAVVGTGHVLSIPLDDHARDPAATTRMKLRKVTIDVDPDAPVAPARKLRRRDSMDRREALLKGKEGSRQRRRWENGKLGPHVVRSL